MSPSTALGPVRVGRTPAGAQLVEESLDQVSARLLREREEAAFERGRLAGEAQANAGAAQALEQAVLRLDHARESALASLGHTTARLAAEIVRRLLRVELSQDRYDLEAMVRETLAATGNGRATCVVHVNPLDAARLADASFRSGTTVEADGGVPRGSVQVSTPHGVLVRDLDEALDSIQERIRADLGERAA